MTSPDKAKTVVEVARDLTAIAAIFLFFSGFVYSYYFLRAFGIPVTATGMPIEFYFVESYSVLRPHALMLGLILLAAVVLRSLLPQINRIKGGRELLEHARRYKARLAVVLLAAAIWLCFSVLFRWSQEWAETQYQCVLAGDGQYDAQITLVDDSKPQEYPDGLLKETNGSRVFLIASSADDFFFLITHPEGDPETVQLPRNRVANVTLDLYATQGTCGTTPGTHLAVDWQSLLDILKGFRWP